MANGNRRLAQLLGAGQLQLTPSPTRSALTARLLQQQNRPAPTSTSVAESANIAAQQLIPALAARRQAQREQEQTANRQALIEQLIGVPEETANIGLADPRTGEVEPRTASRILSSQDRQNQAIAALLAQSPEGAVNVASSMLAQQLSPQERDIREGRPGEFIDFTDPTSPRVVREAPQPSETAEVEDIGQFRVKGVGEATVFRQGDRLFITDDKGKRKFVGSADITEIQSTTPSEFQRLQNQLSTLRAKKNLTDQDKDRIKRIEDRLTALSTPSIQDIVSPIFAKLRSGEELSQAEQTTLDQFLRLSAVDVLTRQALGVGQRDGQGGGQSGQLVQDEDGVFRLR